MDGYKNMACSLVIEVYSFHEKLSERCSDMTDEMFGVITTVNAEAVFEDVTSHHK